MKEDPRSPFVRYLTAKRTVDDRGLNPPVLDALRHRPHSTHFSVEEAVEIARRIGPRRTILTHMAHEVDHDDPLPAGVEFGYDGLVFDAD